jgi:hypothetical protein
MASADPIHRTDAAAAGACDGQMLSNLTTPESCVAEILDRLGARFKLIRREHRDTIEAMALKKLRLD